MDMTGDCFDSSSRPHPVPRSTRKALMAMFPDGFNENQLAFAATVMQTGGVFTVEQAVRWVERRFPGWAKQLNEQQRKSRVTAWLQPLFPPEESGAAMATMHQLGRPGREFAHCGHERAYEAIGMGGARWRRLGAMPATMRRLLVLDYVVESDSPFVYEQLKEDFPPRTSPRQRGWEGWSEEDAWWRFCGIPAQKLALHDHLKIDRGALPWRDYYPPVSTEGAARRCFVDHVALGVGDRRHVFVVPFHHDPTAAALTAVLWSYQPLWAALQRKGRHVDVIIVGREPGWEHELPDLPQTGPRGERIELRYWRSHRLSTGAWAVENDEALHTGA